MTTTKRNSVSVFSLVLVQAMALYSLSVQAEPIKDGDCHRGRFSIYQKGFQVGRVSVAKGQRSYFYDDSYSIGVKRPPGCPYDAGCRKKAYLVRGDTVILGRQQDGWTCVWFFSKKRAFVGWMPSKNVTPVKAGPPPAVSRWYGTWKYRSARIVITRGDGNAQLAVKGDMVSGGLSVHTGSFNLKGSPQAGRLELVQGAGDQWDCRVRMTLLGDYLVASDNRNCGGANASFNGVYRK